MANGEDKDGFSDNSLPLPFPWEEAGDRAPAPFGTGMYFDRQKTYTEKSVIANEAEARGEDLFAQQPSGNIRTDQRRRRKAVAAATATTTTGELPREPDDFWDDLEDGFRAVGSGVLGAAGSSLFASHYLTGGGDPGTLIEYSEHLTKYSKELTDNREINSTLLDIGRGVGTFGYMAGPMLFMGKGGALVATAGKLASYVAAFTAEGGGAGMEAEAVSGTTESQVRNRVIAVGTFNGALELLTPFFLKGAGRAAGELIQEGGKLVVKKATGETLEVALGSSGIGGHVTDAAAKGLLLTNMAILKRFGTKVAAGGVGEFATETLQSIVTQASTYSLTDEPIGGFFSPEMFQQSFYEGFIGAIVGGGITSIYSSNAAYREARLRIGIERFDGAVNDIMSPDTTQGEKDAALGVILEMTPSQMEGEIRAALGRMELARKESDRALQNENDTVEAANAALAEQERAEPVSLVQKIAEKTAELVQDEGTARPPTLEEVLNRGVNKAKSETIVRKVQEVEAARAAANKLQEAANELQAPTDEAKAVVKAYKVLQNLESAQGMAGILGLDLGIDLSALATPTPDGREERTDVPEDQPRGYTASKSKSDAKTFADRQKAATIANEMGRASVGDVKYEVVPVNPKAAKADQRFVIRKTQSSLTTPGRGDVVSYMSRLNVKDMNPLDLDFEDMRRGMNILDAVLNPAQKGKTTRQIIEDLWVRPEGGKAVTGRVVLSEATGDQITSDEITLRDVNFIKLETAQQFQETLPDFLSLRKVEDIGPKARGLKAYTDDPKHPSWAGKKSQPPARSIGKQRIVGRRENGDYIVASGNDPIVNQLVSDANKGLGVEQRDIQDQSIPVRSKMKDGKIKLSEIAAAMDKYYRGIHGGALDPLNNEDHFQLMVKYAREELEIQLQNENSGVGWYTKDVVHAIEQTAKASPFAATPEGRSILLNMAGIFSVGLQPAHAWIIAVKVMESYEKTGKLFTKRYLADRSLGEEIKYNLENIDKATGKPKPLGWGPKGPINSDHLRLYKAIVEREGGILEAADWLFTKHSKEEINETYQLVFKGKVYNNKQIKNNPEPVWGALIVGEKLGRYMMGINGVELGPEDATVDVWYTRTWRRWQGRLQEGPLDEDAGVVGGPDPKDNQAERRAIFRLTEILSEEFGLSGGDVQAALWFREKKVWAAHGAPLNEGTSSEGAKRLLGSRGIQYDERRSGDGEGSGSVSGEGAGTVAETDSGRGEGVQDADEASRRYTPLAGAPVIKGATGPIPEIVEAARKYARKHGLTVGRQKEYVQIDEDRARRVAKAYEEMVDLSQLDPNSPEAKEIINAYEEFKAQVVDQYEALVDAGYTFDLYSASSDPYDGNPWNAMRDLRENKHLSIFYTEADTFGPEEGNVDTSMNPLLEVYPFQQFDHVDGRKKVQVTYNDLFRGVHDAFGHGMEGAGFRAQGEENAFQAHIRLFTGTNALRAVAAETKGQNSWLNYGPYGEQNQNAKVEDTVFAPQKVGLMPEWAVSEGVGESEAAPKPLPLNIGPDRTGQSDRFFDSEALEVAENQSLSFKSREVLVDMPIDTFLTLAKAVEADPADTEARVRELVELAESGVKWSDVPYLMIEDYVARERVAKINKALKQAQDKLSEAREARDEANGDFSPIETELEEAGFDYYDMRNILSGSRVDEAVRDRWNELYTEDQSIEWEGLMGAVLMYEGQVDEAAAEVNKLKARREEAIGQAEQDDNVYAVYGHEARHRAMALREMGYTNMPVNLIHSDVRWDEVTELATKIRAEAPKTDTFVDMPFTKEQLDAAVEEKRNIRKAQAGLQSYSNPDPTVEGPGIGIKTLRPIINRKIKSLQNRLNKKIDELKNDPDMAGSIRGDNLRRVLAGEIVPKGMKPQPRVEGRPAVDRTVPEARTRPVVKVPPKDKIRRKDIPVFTASRSQTYAELFVGDDPNAAHTVTKVRAKRGDSWEIVNAVTGERVGFAKSVEGAINQLKNTYYDLVKSDQYAFPEEVTDPRFNPTKSRRFDLLNAGLTEAEVEAQLEEEAAQLARDKEEMETAVYGSRFPSRTKEDIVNFLRGLVEDPGEVERPAFAPFIDPGSVESIVAKVKEADLPPGGVDAPTNDGRPLEWQYGDERILSTWEQYLYATERPLRLFERIQGDKTQGWATDLFWAPARLANTQYKMRWSGNEGIVSRFNKFTAEMGGPRKFAQSFNTPAEKIYAGLRTELTGSERVGIAMMLEDPAGKRKLENLGTVRNGEGKNVPMSPEAAAEIAQDLSPAERKLFDFLRTYWKDQYLRARVVADELGLPFREVENYYPQIGPPTEKDGGYTHVPTGRQIGENMITESTVKSEIARDLLPRRFTLERMDEAEDQMIQADAMLAFQTQARQMEYWIAHAIPVNKMLEIVNDPRFQKVLRKKYGIARDPAKPGLVKGKDVNKVILKWVTDVSKGSLEIDNYEEYIRLIRQQAAPAILAGKASVVFKQPLSVARAATEYGMMADGDPLMVSAMMMNHAVTSAHKVLMPDIWRAARGQGVDPDSRLGRLQRLVPEIAQRTINPEVNEALDSILESNLNRSSRRKAASKRQIALRVGGDVLSVSRNYLIKNLMHPIQAFDMWALATIADFVITREMSLGATEQEAAEVAQNVIEKTQPMGAMYALPDIYRSGEVVKSLLTFTNQINQDFLQWRRIYRYANGDDPGKDKMKVITFALISMMMTTMMVAATNTAGRMWNPLERENWRTLAATGGSYVASMFPVIGFMGGMVASQVMYDRQFGTPFQTVGLSSVADAASQALDIFDDPYSSKNYFDFGVAVGTMAGVPTQAFKNAIHGVYDTLNDPDPSIREIVTNPIFSRFQRGVQAKKNQKKGAAKSADMKF